jgi:hypothetical protein
VAGEILQALGAKVSTPHPIDLLIEAPAKVIVEAKTVGTGSCGFAIRQAVGQLYEYRHFLRHYDASLCILLDRPPDSPFLTYTEEVLGLNLLWLQDSQLAAGPKSAKSFSEIGVTGLVS